MCGIVGYIGKREALPVLLDGLMRLEYRGYDSAGVAVVHNGDVSIARAEGRVSSLKEKISPESFSGYAGIAHTRWATHGVPSEKNAHPHADCKNEIFVVHNGIVENHRELRSQLEREGHTFRSDTDTEVLSHLIEKFFKDDLPSAVQDALRHVRGAYGIAVCSKRTPDGIVAARFGSPLVVGIGSGENLVASDVTAILPSTREVVYLEDGEVAVLEKDRYSITDLSNRTKKRKSERIEWTLKEAEKEGYAHFMLKEIFDSPDAIVNSMRGRLLLREGTAKLGGLDAVSQKLRTLKRLIIVAMGTARHAGMIGEYMLEEYAGIPVEVEYSSEFAYRKGLLSPDTAVLAVSQSGETADTIIALREAKRKGLLTLGIVNVVGSSIARQTDAGVYNHIGPEIAVASTKAFVSQLTIFALLSLYLGRMREMSKAAGEQIIREIMNLPERAKKILDQQDAIKTVAEKYKTAKHFLYLGRKYNFPVALEGALKLKEISYLHAEGYNGGEMKHGPIALIEEGFPVFVIAPNDSVYEKNINHIQETKLRGAEIIAIASEGNDEIKKLADDVIYIPKTLEVLSPILNVIPLQLFAYYVAVARGSDVDKPRNLAKSVTVE